MIYDIKNGIIYKLKLYIPVIILSIYNCLSIDMNYRNHIPNLSNYIIGIFGGMKVFEGTGPSSRFEMPTIWLLFFLYLTFLVGYYPYKDMDSFGRLIMLKQKGRVKWWINKCVWNFATVIVYFTMTYMTMLVYAIANNRTGLTPNSRVVEKMYGINLENVDITPAMVIQLCVILPLIISIGMSIMQMFLGLFIRPVYSNIISICAIAGTAFVCRDYFVDNYIMFVRNKCVIGENGVDYWRGIIMSIVMILIGIIGGVIQINRKDIIGIED